MEKILIIIATYNEKKNIHLLLSRIFQENKNYSILIVDDNSTDGTLEEIEKIKKNSNNLNILKRPQKLGVGGAHLDGIKWAYKNKFSKVITMDGDLTHSPKNIIKFLNASKKYDLVFGSRFIRSKSIEDWSLHRKILTKFVNFLTKKSLNIDFDLTGSFRCYNISRIPFQVFQKVKNKSYFFFIESAFILINNYFTITEISIDLPKRTYGSSKMNLLDIISSFLSLIRLIFIKSFFKNKIFLNKNFKTNNKLIENTYGKEWDIYWKKDQKIIYFFYDIVAIFYRTFIIKPALNFFLKKQCKKNKILEVLHAGSGSGKVDEDLIFNNNFFALDISKNALDIYSRNHGYNLNIIHGDIFKLPFSKKKFDIIFNLGVMEHFENFDIDKILAEFKRVLKDNGRIILFWPPKNGPTVIFLNTFHQFYNNYAKKKIKLHPEEITHILSKDHANSIIKRNGLVMEHYYHGAKDLYTQVVLTIKK